MLKKSYHRIRKNTIEFDKSLGIFYNSHKRRRKNMEPYNTELTTKTIRFPKDLQATIEQLAKEAERDFSSQVRYMLKEYLKIKQTMQH